MRLIFKTKNIKKYLFLILVFMSFYIAVQNTAFAQDTPNQNANQRIKYLLNVTPAIVNFELTPGKTETFELIVENFLDVPMGIRSSIEPFTYPDQTADYLKESPILKWSEVTPGEFIIEPENQKKIEVKINVPKDAPVGGQYAVVFLTPFYSQETSPDVPTVLSKVGVLLVGSYGKTDFEQLKKDVQINSFGFPLLTSNKNPELKLRVHNRYHNHFTGKPFIALSPLFGKKQNIELEEKNILPNTERLWQQKYNIEPEFPLMIYSTNLRLSIGEGYQIEKNSYFLYFSGASYLKYSLIIIVLLVVVIFRKRLKKAAKVLLTRS
jgi:hypothetical protein